MDNKTLETLKELKRVRENERDEVKAVKQLRTKAMIDGLKRNEDRVRELIEVIELLKTEFNVPDNEINYCNIFYSNRYNIRGLYIGDIFSNAFCVGYDRGTEYFTSDVYDYLTRFMGGFPAFERHVYEIADKVIKSEETRLMSKAQTYEVKIVINANGPDDEKSISEIIGRMGGVIVSFTKNDK